MNNIQKVLLCAMAAGVSAGFFASCDEDDTFDINSPDWLASRVDSIAQSKNNNASGDTTVIELSNTTVGETSNSSGWWTAFSDVVAIPSGKKLTFEFDNYGSGENNWNNWNLAVTNAKATGTTGDKNYKEYFVLRSDAYGWVGGMGDEGYAYEAANITTNYAEAATAAGNDDQWAYFRSVMQGAHVVMEIQHVTAGYVYVTATATATDGTVVWEKYHQTCSASDDIFAFLVCDGSHFENLKAVLTPATIVISESNPARLELSNYPAFLTLGDSAFHEGIAAKVYFEDGTSADADTLDLSYIAPDLSTTGAKTVTVIYNKTSRGNYCSPIYASYQISITDFKKIAAVVSDYTYWFADGVQSVPFVTSTAKVYGIGSEGNSTLVDNANVTFSDVAADGSYTITYQGLSCSGKAVVKALPAPYETNVSYDGFVLGAEDNSSGFWKVFSKDTQVKVSETAVATFTNYSGASSWNNFVVILRKQNLAEYAVVRADNYGWGDGYQGATLESDAAADWATWLAAMNGAKLTVKVTNNGTSVDVVATMVGNNGVTYTQKYLGISIDDPEDVYFAFTVDGSHLVFE